MARVHPSKGPSGYRDCACRDCFDLLVGHAGDLCHDCESAGCEAYPGEGRERRGTRYECQRTDAYGVEENHVGGRSKNPCPVPYAQNPLLFAPGAISFAPLMGLGNPPHSTSWHEHSPEPEDGDITTGDHRHWYQHGKLYHTGDIRGLWSKMNRDKFWPNVFFISDHGNAHPIDVHAERYQAKHKRGGRRKNPRVPGGPYRAPKCTCPTSHWDVSCPQHGTRGSSGLGSSRGFACPSCRDTGKIFGKACHLCAGEKRGNPRTPPGEPGWIMRTDRKYGKNSVGIQEGRDGLGDTIFQVVRLWPSGAVDSLPGWERQVFKSLQDARRAVEGASFPKPNPKKKPLPPCRICGSEARFHIEGAPACYQAAGLPASREEAERWRREGRMNPKKKSRSVVTTTTTSKRVVTKKNPVHGLAGFRGKSPQAHCGATHGRVAEDPRLVTCARCCGR